MLYRKIQTHCMGNVRYMTDGRIFFVKVTVVLKDGRVLSAIDDTSVGDIDLSWNVYLFKAREKWGGKIDTFQVVQLSRYDPEVKKYMREKNMRFMKRVGADESEGFPELELPEAVVREINKKKAKGKMQPGKYRR